MPPTGRRLPAAIAALTAAATTALLGLTVLALPLRAAAAVQKETIDLRSVASAPEYRTDEPKGPGFLGSDAAVLSRSLARINKALGTSLKPDNRLARLARWVYERLGPDHAMPSQGAFDVVTHRLGLPEPDPHLLLTEASDAPRLANVVSSRLARLFDIAEYTHIGGVAERETRWVVVVIVLSRRPFQMVPVPRSLAGPGEIELEGRLGGAYKKPELAHTLPSGETRIETLGSATDFRKTVALAATGRHRLEIMAQGRSGPTVLANFPVFVGVPVDETVAAAAPPGPAARPEAAKRRLFDLINADRAKAGLDALTLDPELSGVALRHSEDMRDNDFAGHVSPTTGSMEQRLLRAGIVSDLAAENVAKGYSADEIHQGLMDSPGHRAAILLAGATHVGLGIVPKKEISRTTYFATELFIRRIPALGSDAKTIFSMELNGLRQAAGLPKLEEDPELATLADETARDYLADPNLSQKDILERLKDRIAKGVSKSLTLYFVFSVVGSLEDGAKQAAADPRGDKARRIGIGIAQGSRPGLVPNSIVIVLIYAE
jgi:uncharacterized protein YkwD